jgi:hypothetical protein
MRTLAGWLVALVLIAPRPAWGQVPAADRDPPRGRFFIDANLFGVASSQDDARTFESKFIIYSEAGSFRAHYPIPSTSAQALLDVGGGYNLTTRFAIGASYTRMVFEDTIGLEATIPHPTVINASATGTGTTAGTLQRTEASANIFVALIPVRTDQLELRVFGGPSWFFYSADLVNDVQYTQVFDPLTPQNAITITGSTSELVTGTGFGGHGGTDVTYFVTRWFGVSGGLRYSVARVTIEREPLSQLSQKVRVGATLIFAGVRVRFGK